GLSCFARRRDSEPGDVSAAVAGGWVKRFTFPGDPDAASREAVSEDCFRAILWGRSTSSAGSICADVGCGIGLAKTIASAAAFFGRLTCFALAIGNTPPGIVLHHQVTNTHYDLVTLFRGTAAASRSGAPGSNWAT